MKKLTLSILTILYMTMSSGIALEIHYCMGKRAGVEFYSSTNDRCSRCGMKEKKGGCCNDEHRFYKLNDSHKNVHNEIKFEAGEVALVTNYPAFVWQMPAGKYYPSISIHSPPDDTGASICIRNCVFRI